MLHFGREAPHGMALVQREPSRLLFSTSLGDLVVEVEAGRASTVSVLTTHWHAEAQAFLAEQGDPLDGVIHYETASTVPPDEVLRRAHDDFGKGPEGLGLEVLAEGPRALEFAGGGGRVSVQVSGDGPPMVRVAARAWAYQAEEFVRRVSSER